MNGKVKGNLAMFISKVFSGFNENALRYLLPQYMSACTGVFLRTGFATLFFWVLGLFRHRAAVAATLRQRVGLLLLGRKGSIYFI